MGVIVKEEYVCDLCGQEIARGQSPYVGVIDVRKQGSRGLGRKGKIVGHETCVNKLFGGVVSTNGHATRARKAPAKAKAKPAPKAPVKIKASISKD
jgi:hypothetical protein